MTFTLVATPEKVMHDFVFKAESALVKKVCVAGMFNNWSSSANPMSLGDDGRTWTTRIGLPFGRIQYKFVVNGSDWTLDPMAASVSDGNGHTNSELVVLPPDYSESASPTDGKTALSALLHEPTAAQMNYDRGKLEVKFRARPDDLAEVDLVENGHKLPMKEAARSDIYSTYRVEIPWDRKHDLTYAFELHDGSKTAYYGKAGYSGADPEKFVLSAKDFKPFTVPNWVDRTVVYQIFPDRFADGDPSNDPKNVQSWNAEPTFSNRFGGDAAGVRQHLDYLKSLGIGAVYFTPVFQSPSNHRYDTTDYRKVDPQFGTNLEFDDLTKAMKADGIRTVMDFAFNHTATNFFAFEDIKQHGETSRYLPWYFIKSFPVTERQNPPYVAWSDYPSMPKLNVMNSAAEKYILGSVDYWMNNASLDGVRLDVANEIDPQLWKDLRAHVKTENPNFWIVGEEWGDAGPWLKGDQWDSTMGYQFRQSCLSFFAEGSSSASEFMASLMSVYDSYPPQASRNLMNLLGSHDTARFLTLCHDDVKLLELAATVQLTWPGTPSIYYGDELGMQGGADPANRRGMQWQTANVQNPVLNYYKKLIGARNHSQALQEGDPVVLKTDDRSGCFAFVRLLDSDAALIAVNRSDAPQTISLTIPDESRFNALRKDLVDLIGGGTYRSTHVLTLNLSPKSAAVLLPRQEHDQSALLTPSGGRKQNSFRTPKSISSQGAK